MDEESGNTPRHTCRDKDVLGIHSPSAEMHAIGANLGMGLMAGLLSQDVPGRWRAISPALAARRPAA
jgi:hypothetical protein